MVSCFIDTAANFCRYACRECPSECIQTSTPRCEHCLRKDEVFEMIHRVVLARATFSLTESIDFLADKVKNAPRDVHDIHAAGAWYTLAVAAVLFRIHPETMHGSLPQSSQILAHIHDSVRTLKQFAEQSSSMTPCFMSDLSELCAVYDQWLLRLSGKILLSSSCQSSQSSSPSSSAP